MGEADGRGKDDGCEMQQVVRNRSPPEQEVVLDAFVYFPGLKGPCGFFISATISGLGPQIPGSNEASCNMPFSRVS